MACGYCGEDCNGTYCAECGPMIAQGVRAGDALTTVGTSDRPTRGSVTFADAPQNYERARTLGDLSDNVAAVIDQGLVGHLDGLYYEIGTHDGEPSVLVSTAAGSTPYFAVPFADEVSTRLPLDQQCRRLEREVAR